MRNDKIIGLMAAKKRNKSQEILCFAFLFANQTAPVSSFSIEPPPRECSRKIATVLEKKDKDYRTIDALFQSTNRE